MRAQGQNSAQKQLNDIKRLCLIMVLAHEQHIYKNSVSTPLLHPCEKGKSLQRTSPKSHLPEKDCSGVKGTEKVHIRMSGSGGEKCVQQIEDRLITCYSVIIIQIQQYSKR